MWSIDVPALTVKFFERPLTELTITTRQALQANDQSSMPIISLGIEMSLCCSDQENVNFINHKYQLVPKTIHKLVMIIIFVCSFIPK